VERWEVRAIRCPYFTLGPQHQQGASIDCHRLSTRSPQLVSSLGAGTSAAFLHWHKGRGGFATVITIRYFNLGFSMAGKGEQHFMFDHRLRLQQCGSDTFFGGFVAGFSILLLDEFADFHAQDIKISE